MQENWNAEIHCNIYSEKKATQENFIHRKKVITLYAYAECKYNTLLFSDKIENYPKNLIFIFFVEY